MTTNRELVQAAVIEYEESLIDAERDSRRLTDQERFDRLVQTMTALLDAKDAELAETRREIELGYPGRPAEEVEAVRKLVDAAESWSQGGVSSAAVHEAVDGLPPRWEDWLSGLTYDPLGLVARLVVLEGLAWAVLSRCHQQVEEAESEARRVSLSDDVRGRAWGRRSAYRDISSLVGDWIKGAPHPAVEAVREVLGLIDLAYRDGSLGIHFGGLYIKWRAIRRDLPALTAALEKR